jgi:MAC/Perforin domain
MPNPVKLDGLWKYDWDDRKLDDKSAIAIGHVRTDGSPAPHGTYTAIQYFWVRTTPEDSHTVFDIFNDQGDFGRFVWNGKDAWEAKADEVTFKVADKNLAKDVELQLRPSLILRKYETANCPSNASPGDLYIASDPAANMAEITTQTIVPNDIEKTFSWKSNTYGELTFKQCYQQLSEKGERDNTFGDTFKGATKMAQIAFPFYGFNPSKMSLDASGPLELAPTGPGTPSMSAVETNPNQSFNGTLVFAFPTEDSKDYVRVEDLPDQPFLPLGLSGMPLDNKEELAHTEMVSSAKDQMQSWSVTLGLSAGIEGLMDIGVEGSVHDKLEEQTKTESRYTVSRKVAKKWVIHADIPSHRLHDDFINAVKQRTIALLNNPDSDPRWDDFVTSYGTHYTHAITQGSIEFAETRFSLQAETKAHTQGLDLKTEASAVIEGAKLGASFDYSKEWEDKTGIEISKEDIASYSFGTDFPMGIFFDLRPLYELFSPVFFSYNPADDTGKYAPFIWHTARKSFYDFLVKRGVNKPSEIDYIPRVFKVTFPTITVKFNGNGSWGVGMDIDTSETVTSATPLLEIPANLGIPYDTPYNTNYGPNATGFYCKVVGRAIPGKQLTVNLAWDWYFRTDSSTEMGHYNGGKSFAIPDPPDNNVLESWFVFSDYPWQGLSIQVCAHAEELYSF